MTDFVEEMREINRKAFRDLTLSTLDAAISLANAATNLESLRAALLSLRKEMYK
jgi:hypothetical protein